MADELSPYVSDADGPPADSEWPNADNPTTPTQAKAALSDHPISEVIGGHDYGEQLFGTDGPDEIHGGGGNDFLGGGPGNDFLFGDAGSDSLAGQSGNDYLDGGANGGPGVDINTASYFDAPGPVTLYLFITGPQDTGSAGTDTLVNINSFEGSPYGDNVYGAEIQDWMWGGGGPDNLFGNGGPDYIVGADG
jgi:hypothetical protein